MSTKVYPYRSNRQFDRIIGQFTRAFSGFQVMDGVSRTDVQQTYRVPVVYGAMDRVIAAMINKRGFFASNRSLPVMSVVNTGISTVSDKKHSNRHVDSYIPNDDGDDSVTHERLIGVPVEMSMEVSIMCSSKSELYDLIEQIMLCFNPRLAVTLDDDKNNPDAVSEISLDNISPEITMPLGSEQSSVSCTMGFTFSTRITYPYNITNTVIHEIESNMKVDEDFPEVDYE